MKKLLYLLLFFVSGPAFSQNEKFSPAFINLLTPTYPGCENASDKSKCYHIGVGNLIVEELNRTHSYTDEKIQVELLLKTEADGKTTVSKVKHQNPEVVKAVRLALSKMPLVKPLKSKTTGKNEVSSSSFFCDCNQEQKTPLRVVLQLS